MNRLVIIADVVNSRRLPDRASVQTRLDGLLGDLNASRAQLLSPYTITLGDEFQAVFDGADRYFPDLLAIMGALHPVEIRFAASIGPLSTGINTQQAIGMDGPAFHQARDLLERMKKQNRTLAIAGLPKDDGLVDGALGLLNHHLRKWRPNRLDVLRWLLLERDVHEIALHLDITEQSVYKNIRDGALEPTIQLMQALTGRMNAALAEAH
ncbi:MAG: SatD family protein [Phycisphaerae bacterium]